jgi:hypothetical protein
LAHCVGQEPLDPDSFEKAKNMWILPSIMSQKAGPRKPGRGRDLPKSPEDP